MSKDDERFWNFLIYDFYGTNKELEQTMPVIGIIALILVCLFLVCGVCNNNKHHVNEPIKAESTR
jgi:hypothetical protein